MCWLLHRQHLFHRITHLRYPLAVHVLTMAAPAGGGRSQPRSNRSEFVSRLARNNSRDVAWMVFFSFHFSKAFSKDTRYFCLWVSGHGSYRPICNSSSYRPLSRLDPRWTGLAKARPSLGGGSACAFGRRLTRGYIGKLDGMFHVSISGCTVGSQRYLLPISLIVSF